MPWYKLPSGLPWWGHKAPASGVPIENPANVPVDSVPEGDVVGSGVEVDVVPDAEQPLQVVPGVVGVGGSAELDGSETVPATVDDLMGFTVPVLRDRAREAGLDVPSHIRKADLVAMIHEAEDTSG